MKLGILLLAMLTALIAIPAFAGPVITWVSDPVRPDETALMLTEGCSESTVVEAARLDDTPTAGPGRRESPALKWTAIKPLQASRHCVKAVIPTGWKPGVFALRLKEGADYSLVAYANVPTVFWLQGDEGQRGTPGGWVRVFGRCLGFGGKAEVRLRPEKGLEVPLKVTQTTCWALTASLPGALASGEYSLLVHNGLGGSAAWRDAGKLQIIPPVAWKTDTFTVSPQGEGEAGEKAIRAALDRAKANGGGIVLLQAGTYDLSGSLTIPPYTILKGEAPGRVSLYWKNSAAPPESLITGADYGLENFSLYCFNYRRVISDTQDSERFRMSHVRIRAVPEATRAYTIKQTNEILAALHLQGRNFQVTNSDIYAAVPGNAQGRAIVTGPWGFASGKGPYYGLMADNEIYGHMYGCENLKGLIFERNSVTGVCVSASTYWNNFSQDVYVADCAIRHVYGGDREIMTFDGAAGAYFGKAAKADGTHLTLASDPVYHDAAPVAHTDARGMAVFIMDGTGAGQYRFVTANQGREWDVNRPWLVPPDATSVLSIVPFRGRNIFVNNTFTDGGAMQLYGSAADEIVAGNKGVRIDGFYTWGLNGYGWGFQPAWTAQYLDNEILEPSGFGGRIWGPSFFGVITSDDKPEAGPLARGNVLRRNLLDEQCFMNIGGTATDTLVEGCVIKHTPIGVKVGKSVQGLVLRKNAFEDVAAPVSGEGAAGALVVNR